MMNRFFSYVFFGFLFGLVLASCSSDDELVKDETGFIINEKKLQRIHTTLEWYSGIDSYEYNFLYSEKGKLSRVSDKHFSSDCYYIFEKDKIKIKLKKEELATCTIVDNLIRTIKEVKDNEPYFFTYNYQNRLILIKHGNDKIIFNWKNGTLEKLICNVQPKSWLDWFPTSIEYVYDGSQCKGYFPMLASLPGRMDVFFPSYIIHLSMTHPELIGMRTNKLPMIVRTIYDDASLFVIPISYTFDKNGYIESCIEDSEPEKFNHTFTWW